MNNKSIVVSLHRIACFVSSRKFIKLYNSNQSRFAYELLPLFDKLRFDFNFQAQAAINWGYRSGWRENNNMAVPMSYGAPIIAKAITKLADTLSNKYNVKTTLKECKFVVPRDSNILDIAYDAFNADFSKNLCVSLSKLDRQSSPLQCFDVCNFISALGKFIESIYTLNRANGNDKFDYMLNHLFKTKGVEYFVAGYPMDILAHDASALRCGSKIVSIKINTDYCSTEALMDQTEKMKGFRYYPM